MKIIVNLFDLFWTVETNNATSEPYDQYDYDRNHPELNHSVPPNRSRRNDYTTTEAEDAYQYESTNNPEEKELPPGASSPHICFSRDHSSTTCKITILYLTDDEPLNRWIFEQVTCFWAPITSSDSIRRSTWG